MPELELLPVMDLMGGQVVHARQGARERYRPLASPLCAGSDPLTVADALLRRTGAKRLYVADLDALSGRSAQQPVLRALLQARPELSLWLDAGLADVQAAHRLRDALGACASRMVPVHGSESIASIAALAGIAEADHVLSLDRRAGQRLDAAACWDHPELWPGRLIVMTLERVGTAAGPDTATLAAVKARRPALWVAGAGGWRGPADSPACLAAGASAWLVASALHRPEPGAEAFAAAADTTTDSNGGDGARSVI